MHEHRNFRGSVNRADSGDGISGVAAVFYDGTERTEFELFPGVVERVMPGAFDKALTTGEDVRALFNHDPNHVLGRTSAGTARLRSTKVGLEYDVDLGDTTVARDVKAHIERRDVTGSSFGFRVTDDKWETEDGIDVRSIHGVELFDVGPVTFPAYGATSAESNSQGDHEEARRSWEAWKSSHGRDEREKQFQELVASRGEDG